MARNSYQICKRCILDTTDPHIQFDSNGICNHCLFFERNIKKDWFPNDEGKQILLQVVNKIKEEGKNKEYDSIIGLSGGVDSSYLAFMIKKELGLRPLAVHVDCGWNSEIAVKNIENIVKKLNIDLYTHVIDWEEIKDLQIAFFRSGLANQDIPQDHAFFAKMYEFAVKNHIKYVIQGGNIATESVMPEAWAYNAMDLRHLKAVHKRFGEGKLKTFPTLNFFQYYIYYPILKGMKVVRPLNYVAYNKEEAIKVLTNEVGFRYYGGKHFESRFTKFQQAYYRPVKFGYDERRAYLSSLILSGQKTREAALREIEKKEYSEEELKEEIAFIIKKLRISENTFNEFMAIPNKTFRDYPSNYFLFLFKDKFKGILKKFISR